MKEVEWIPSGVNTKIFTPRCIVERQTENLATGHRKMADYIQGRKHNKINIWFLIKISDQCKGKDLLYWKKEKIKCQPKILLPEKLYFKNEGKACLGGSVG